ncbi:hypothetical protein BU23DRAFT_113994 [Bimuria novae-zelandiae CBS 107.79]|uniref:Uncharacterized protein n=1 Tax=Bimuria novae-zelandiae CBS 107.79 TaxID=1447943 RepID=A0A6A5VAY3_9PLEO|nr:hypothetical protein BU23DRAFT_113994 [Bimuria novae-zelandiae CBS 107.79]
MVSDYAIGYGAQTPSAQSYVRTDLTPGERQLCGVQRMIKSGGFVNVNVFGLSFIISFACLVMILNLLMVKFLVFLSKFRRALAPRIDRWVQDGVFQLQRRAYEGNRQGTWKLLNSEIPVTASQELLEELPLETHCPTYSGVDLLQTCESAGTELDTLSSQAIHEAATEPTDDNTSSEEYAAAENQNEADAAAIDPTSRA